jgi:hypothetical protein
MVGAGACEGPAGSGSGRATGEPESGWERSSSSSYWWSKASETAAARLKAAGITSACQGEKARPERVLNGLLALIHAVDGVAYASKVEAAV